MRRILLAASLAAVTFVASAAPHGLTAADLVSFARLSEPALSPDGRRVVYTMRETDLAADRGRTDLWLLDLDDDSQPRRLTSHEENDGAADWAPGGKGVFFLSSRSGSPQVWYLPLIGGEAMQVTRLPLEVASFRASPRGDRLAIAIEVFPDCRDLPCTKKRLDDNAAAKQHGQAFDQLFVRHWDKWEDGRVSKLFSVPLDAQQRARGEPVALSAQVDGDVPSKPQGGRADYAFSPDGTQVVFAARTRGRIEPISTNFDIWRVPADGSAAPVNLTPDNPAWDAQPAYSPNGELLAHLAMERPGFEADRFRLVVRDAASGAIRFTTRDWDRSISSFRFSPDGKEVYATVDDMGQHPLFAIDVSSGARRKLTAAGSVTDFDAAGSRLVYGLQTLSAPADLYLIDGRGPAHQVTDVNKARLADVRFGEYEQFSFAGAGGENVYGYAVKPWNYSAGQRYPVAFIELSLESPGLRGRGLRRRVHRFPRLAGLWAGIHRFDQPRLGRQAPRGPPEGARRSVAEISLARRRPGLCARRILRRLHDELDCGQLARRLPLPREPCGTVRPPFDVLHDRGALVPGVGPRRAVFREPGGAREVEPRELREGLEDADARDPRCARLSRAVHAGPRDLHGAAAPRHREPLRILPRREPLGAEAGEQPAVARRSPQVAGCPPEEVAQSSRHSAL
jgi:Tol biopolymer transport system component